MRRLFESLWVVLFVKVQSGTTKKEQGTGNRKSAGNRELELRLREQGTGNWEGTGNWATWWRGGTRSMPRQRRSGNRNRRSWSTSSCLATGNRELGSERKELKKLSDERVEILHSNSNSRIFILQFQLTQMKTRELELEYDQPRGSRERPYNER